MNNLSLCLPENAVFMKDGRPVTTSLKVAEVFGKRHKHVIRAIEKICRKEEFSEPIFGPANSLMKEISWPIYGPPNYLIEEKNKPENGLILEEFSRRNFEPRDYIDSRGKTYPMYEITRDGFAFLAMGFTGPRAAQFKIAFIDRFNEMEAALKQGFIQSSTQHENYWFARRPHWPPIRVRVLAGQAYREIAAALGMSRERVARAVKTMIRVGLLAPLKVAAVQRGQARCAALHHGQGWGQQLSLWQQPSLFEMN